MNSDMGDKNDISNAPVGHERTQALTHGAWRELAFEAFRDGVEIYWLKQTSPQIALLKYQPGASVPRHRHPGTETILVLEGDQVDDNGTAIAGDFLINHAGSDHAVRSETGCVVLIQWQKPVEFI